jgi:hypothetical protein
MTFSYTVGDIPSYCQLGSHRCGATCAQMTIQFCCEKDSLPYVPSWYDGTTANQQYICNESGGVWSGWMKDYHDAHSIPYPYKHPDAVKGAIMDLKETAPGNFNVFHNTDPSAVMHDMVYWIKRMDYPAPTMKGGSHWVLVYGFETDIEPTPDNTVTLERISIIEPACSPCADPANGGIDIPDILGSTWWTNYWYQGVTLWAGHLYHGEYVAVVEPPATKGRVKIEKEYIGTKREIIPGTAAMKKASEYVRKRKLTQYEALRFMSDASPQTPLLVEWPDQKRFYYLVPFALKRGGPAKAVMILNPYNGNYQECGALCCPISFIPDDVAVKLMVEKMRIRKYKKISTSLKYIYSSVSCTHYNPFWEINVDGRLYYVDMNRGVHKTLVTY